MDDVFEFEYTKVWLFWVLYLGLVVINVDNGIRFVIMNFMFVLRSLLRLLFLVMNVPFAERTLSPVLARKSCGEHIVHSRSTWFC